MRKRKEIKTKEQARAYLLKVLKSQEAFADAHRPFKQVLQIILEKESQTKVIVEFTERIAAHYPHTGSVQNTIYKESIKFIKEIENERDLY